MKKKANKRRPLEKIIDLFLKENLTDEKLQAFLESGLISNLLRADPDNIDIQVFQKVLGIKPFKIFNAMVSYEIDLDSIIEEEDYDFVDEIITAKNFPIPSEKQGVEYIKTVVRNFNKEMDYIKINKKLFDKGLRPANLFETLAFVSQNLDQNPFPLIALGSTFIDTNDNHWCVSINNSGFMSLRTEDLTATWDSSYNFLAVLI